MPLTNAAWTWAANQLKCSVAAIKAVAEVECPKAAFLPGEPLRPVILFEAHKFGQFTKYVFNASHPKLSTKNWNRSLYSNSEGEHKRLEQAVALNREAALKATSWGRFQLMGFNYRLCGFKTIQDFVNAMYESEEAQLRAFVNFLQSTNLDVPLRHGDWPRFALGYNGPGHAANNYVAKLKKAAAKYAKTTIEEV